MNSAICVIPARLHSSRLPRKLLAQVDGKTILEYTIEQALKCPEIEHLFVATDHEEIAQVAEKMGVSSIFTSEECQNGTERIVEALNKTKALQTSDFLVNLQGDHPCTSPQTLSKVIQALQNDQLAVMSTAATKILKREDYLSPHKVKVVFDENHRALYFSRSPIPYTMPGLTLEAYAHIGLYCYKTSFLKSFFDKRLSSLQKSEDLEQLKVLENGHKIKIAVVDEIVLGIDTPQDLQTFKEYVHRCPLSISS